MKHSLLRKSIFAAVLMTGCGYIESASAGILALPTALCISGQPVHLTAQIWNTGPEDYLIYSTLTMQADFFSPDNTTYTTPYTHELIEGVLLYVGQYQTIAPINILPGYYSVTGFPSYTLVSGGTIYMDSIDASCLAGS